MFVSFIKDAGLAIRGITITTEIRAYGKGFIGSPTFEVKTMAGTKREKTIVIDPGLNFKQYGKYFCEFLNPRSSVILSDLMTLDIIPATGWYRPDLVENAGRYRRRLKAGKKADLVLESHAHLDHIANSMLIHPETVFVTSKPSYAIKQTLEVTNPRYKHLITAPSGDEVIDREHILLDDRKKEHSLDDIVIEGWHVDHSVPGSMGFFIHTPDMVIMYTGDYQLDGSTRDKTLKFFKRGKELAKEKPLLMITEGTNIDEEEVPTEAYVRERLEETISSSTGLKVVSYPIRDLERFNSVNTTKGKNQFSIDLRQVYLLHRLWELGCSKLTPAINPKAKDGIGDLLAEDLKVYVPRRMEGRILKGAGAEESAKDFNRWARPFIEEGFDSYIVSAKDIKKNEGDYVMTVSGIYGLKEILDIMPKKRKATFIHSMTEPFDPEMEIDQEREMAWVNRFFGRCEAIHSSGHPASGEYIDMARYVNPKYIMPTHSENLDLFKQLLLKAGFKDEQILIPDSSMNKDNPITLKRGRVA
ncbi:MAG: hypothetical protein KJ709_04950 [Nanoarchaeota archaeon]|nr:hypothetical protein [Nanoarchaeota archaeon]